MRNVNIFRTHVTDHIIPSEIMRRAIVLSPGKDWTDQKTEAYKYLKRWALEQDKRYPPKEKLAEVPDYEVMTITLKSPGEDDIVVTVPPYIVQQARLLGNPEDKRTKAYKYIMRTGVDWTTPQSDEYKYMMKWALEQDNNENSK